MTTRRFNHVIFADDFFRSAANGLPYHAANRRFLRGFFDSALGRLGLPVREMAPLEGGGRIDVARLMARLDLSATPAGWARACIADLLPVHGREGLPAFDPGCLVIGWGLTPALQHCIARSGASYLDIEIDPRRFTEHLHFCARTNDSVIAAALQARRVDEEVFWNHASALKGHFARHGAPALFDPRLRIGLFFGQSLVDLSLVSGGRTMHPASVVAPLRELARSVDLLVIKPHPYEPALHDLAPIARAIPNAAWTGENTYALLSAGNVHFAASLSSSVLTEARYFRKPAHALIRADRNAAGQLPVACSAWIPVGPELGAMDFMSAVCGIADAADMAVMTNTADTAPRHVAAWPTTAIDRAFMTRWGFDDQSRGLRDVAELQLGRPYLFHRGSPAAGWLSQGWSAPDAEGAKSVGESACLVIPLPSLAETLSRQQPHRLEVRIDYRCNLKATSVHAMFDGVVLPGSCTTGAKRRSLVFEVQPTAGRKCLVLQFVVADAARGNGRRAVAAPGFTLRKLQVSLRTARGVVSMPPAVPSPVRWSEMRPVRALARVFRALRDSARGVTG
ncbi:hypothetical protein J2W34_005582 [Variovorax boronicumulans]|uniref:hypothetical protein n=1 Tax=Variovorax boronicumulans TaxID=436515 RepID=UPI0027875F93|nr:hypothetical protein [Variovorax boronicumulans]MDQ0073762.1 hypothetical protein [Variovorax boronicumulans]